MKKIFSLLLISGISCFPILGEEDEPTLKEEISELWTEMKERVSKKPDWWKELEEIKKKVVDEEPEWLVESLEELLEEEDNGQMLKYLYEYVLDYRVEALAKKVRYEKDEAKKKELRKTLRAKLSELLQHRLKQREAEVAELEKELKQLRKGIESARTNPDRFIDKKLSELLEEDEDPFEW